MLDQPVRNYQNHPETKRIRQRIQEPFVCQLVEQPKLYNRTTLEAGFSISIKHPEIVTQNRLNNVGATCLTVFTVGNIKTTQKIRR